MTLKESKKLNHKVLILIILIIYPSLTFSQTSKFSLGIAASPNFYFVNPDLRGYYPPYTVNSAYSLGTELYYSLTEKGVIRSGLYYSKISYEVGYYYFDYYNNGINPISGRITAAYLDIPLLYDFNFIKKEKLSIYSSIGITPSFILFSEEIVTFNDNVVRDFEALNKFSLSFQNGLGIKYNIHEKFGIKLEPQFKYFFKSFDKKLWSNRYSDPWRCRGGGRSSSPSPRRSRGPPCTTRRSRSCRSPRPRTQTPRSRRPC